MWYADSDLGNSRDNNAMNNSYTSAASSQAATHPYIPNGLLQEAGSSPGSEQSKVNRQVGHSRHVSWDDTYPDLSSSGGLVDSGSRLSSHPSLKANLVQIAVVAAAIAAQRSAWWQGKTVAATWLRTWVCQALHIVCHETAVSQ